MSLRPQVWASQQHDSVVSDDAHTAAANSLSPDSRRSGNAISRSSSHSAQPAPDSLGVSVTAASAEQQSASQPQPRRQRTDGLAVYAGRTSAQRQFLEATLSHGDGSNSPDGTRWRKDDGSMAIRTSIAPSDARQRSHSFAARPDARLLLDAIEPASLQRGSTAPASRHMLAVETPPFAISPAQSGVRVDSPSLRINGAPTQLFQIDFGKATAELNPIRLFTVTGAVECATTPFTPLSPGHASVLVCCVH